MSAALAAAALLAVPSFGASLRVCDDVVDPPSLNPYQVFSEKTHTLLQQTLEGLVRFNPEGGIEPTLAERWERIDDTTLRFHLRKNVEFHNGEALDASAVKFSLERYVAPETRFVGYEFVKTIASVTVVDSHTVDVRTHGRDGLLLNRLAAWIHIVPPAYFSQVSDAGFAEKPVGTGPFIFERWERGKRVVLKANSRYWMSGVPRVEGLVFEFIPSDRQVDALLRGEIDILTSLPGTRTLEVQRNPGTYVTKKQTFYTIAGNFNFGRKPLSDKRVREALNLAVDRSSLIRYDTFGNGVPIGTLSLPGEFGHNAGVRPYEHDPKKARRLLREAGYPDGFTLKTLLKRNAERTGRIIAKHLQAVGVTLDLTLFADADIWTYFKDRTPWDMAIYDCPDPMHHAFFIRSIFVAGSSPFSLSADAGIDERMADMASALEPQEQRAASEDLDRYIHDEFLALPTYQRVRTYGLRRGVEFAPYISGMPYFYGVSIHAKESK